MFQQEIVHRTVCERALTCWRLVLAINFKCKNLSRKLQQRSWHTPDCTQLNRLWINFNTSTLAQLHYRDNIQCLKGEMNQSFSTFCWSKDFLTNGLKPIKLQRAYFTLKPPFFFCFLYVRILAYLEAILPWIYSTFTLLHDIYSCGCLELHFWKNTPNYWPTGNIAKRKLMYFTYTLKASLSRTLLLINIWKISISWSVSEEYVNRTMLCTSVLHTGK